MTCWYQATSDGPWVQGSVLGYVGSDASTLVAVVAMLDKSRTPCGAPVAIPLAQIHFGGYAPS